MISVCIYKDTYIPCDMYPCKFLYHEFVCIRVFKDINITGILVSVSVSVSWTSACIYKYIF